MSSSGSGGAPRSTQNAEKLACSSPICRAYSARKSSQPDRSSVGSPENTGGSAGSRTSSGLQEALQPPGPPRGGIVGNEQPLSSTITSGVSPAKTSTSRSST